MLRNIHADLTWSWAAAQFRHSVLHVTLLLCWGEHYRVSEEHPAIPAFSARGCLAHPFPGRRDKGLSPISLQFIPDQDQNGLALVSRGWLPKAAGPTVSSTWDKVWTSYSRLITNDGLASLPKGHESKLLERQSKRLH